MPVRIRSSSSGETTQVIDESTAPLPEAPGPPPPGAPVEEPPSGRDIWPWLLVLLVLVIAALVGAWLASRHNNQRSANSTTAQLQTISAAPVGKAPARIAVPRVIGFRAPAALSALRRAGLAGTTRGVFSATPSNRVVAQSPAAAVQVKRGATVTLDVSKGRKPVAVPDVTGQQVAAALDTLRAQGLRGNVVRVPSDQAAGQVVAQHPRAGASTATASAVRLNVAAGPSPGRTTPTPERASPPAPPAAPAVTVPDVRGQRINEARKQLREEALVLEIRKVPNSLPKNTVVSQSPRPDTTAKQGDHVLVTVSSGAAKGKKEKSAGAVGPAAATPIPDVSGEDETTATQDLEAAGFEVQAVDQETTDESEDGLVVGQDPSAGRQAATGSKVIIHVGRFGG